MTGSLHLATSPNCRKCVVLRSAAVFALRGDSAANVPLRLVFLKDLLNLKIQRSVVKGQTLPDILMYRGFGHAELFCGLAHGGSVFYDIGRKLAGALLDITFQDPTRSLSRYTGVYALRGEIMQKSYAGKGKWTGFHIRDVVC